MAINPFQPPSTGGNAPRSSEPLVTDKHPAVLEFEPTWRRVSHVLGGTDTMRSHARGYIPPSHDHIRHPETYADMIARAPFTNYAGRTVDGLEGLIFRKDPSVTVPARYKPRLENVNNSGDGINTFAKKITREILSFGRAGLLVDALPADQQTYDSPTSLLPYLAMYSTFSIYNWRLRNVNGQIFPDQIVLREQYDEPQAFGSYIRNRFRVLELDEQSRYRIRLYEQRSETGEFYLAYEFYPNRGSAVGQNYFNRIPFVFIGTIDLSPTVHRSPILDIVDSNIDHFRLSCDHATALHLTAQPTPVISGWQEGVPADFRVGGGNLWLLPDGAKAEILEFHGDGLGPLERALTAKENHIAELGARLLQSAASGPETAEAARIRQFGQTSVVSSIARTVSDGIKAAIEIACSWAAADGEIEVQLNQDYLDVVMDPRMLAQLTSTTASGYMTKKDLIWNLQRGELLEPGRTVEQILGELESEKPTLVGQPDPAIAVAPRQNGAAPANGTTRRQRSEPA